MKKYLPLFVAKLCAMIVLFGSFSQASYADGDIWPERVTDFTTKWDSSTGYVTVQLTAPTHSMTSLGSGNGEALPYLTKIVLSRNLNYGEYIEVHVFENPAPGEELTHVDMTVGEGLYQYKAVAYVDDYASYPEWSEIEIGQKPVDINDAYATCNKGNAPVTIFFTAPLLDTNGDVLKAIEKIEVSRYSYDTYAYEVIGSIANPTPGEACSFSDNDVVSGESYSYRLVVYTTAGNSYGTVVNVMVGLDTPLEPTNVEARVGSNAVYITWKAPQKGQTNGYIDVSELRYTVLRSATGSEYDAEKLVEDWVQIEYADTEVFAIESKYTYYVRATNAQGESIGAPSNAVVVGPPSALPYIETFDNTTIYDVPTTDYPGWTYATTETACAWYVSEEAILEDRTIAPESGEGGLAYVQYGSYNDLSQDDYMTTGKIDLRGAYGPMLKFRYYAFAGFNSTLAIEISKNGGAFEEVGFIDYDGMPQEGWESYVMSLYSYMTSDVKYIQVRLHAHKGTYACPVIVDNFVISDLPLVENVSYDSVKGLLSWSAPQSEYFEVTGYVIGLNGTKMAELPANVTEYDYSRFADEDFLTFGIVAVYEGQYWSDNVVVDLTSVEGVEATQAQVYAVEGMLHVEAANGVAVEVYTLDAQRVLVCQGSVVAELSRGMYIVKVGSEVRKVLVK